MTLEVTLGEYTIRLHDTHDQADVAEALRTLAAAVDRFGFAGLAERMEAQGCPTSVEWLAKGMSGAGPLPSLAAAEYAIPMQEPPLPSVSVAAAAAVALAEASYLVFGPCPGIKPKDMTQAQRTAALRWVLEDPAQQEARAMQAFEQLGAAFAYERERLFWEAFARAGRS